MVALILAVSVIIGIIYIGTRPDPYRPDQQPGWPPTPGLDSVELQSLPKGYTPPPPQTEVYWEEYRPGFKTDIDKAGDAIDCGALADLFGEAMMSPAKDRLALTYINAWGEHLKCPEFIEDPEQN